MSDSSVYPLHEAVKKKDLEAAKFLVEEHWYDVNERNVQRQLETFPNKDSGIFRHGEPDYSRIYGAHTPIHFAAQNGDIEMCRYLLSKGASVTFSHYISPPLRLAVESGCLETVKLLVEAGANPNEISESSSVQTAIRLNHSHIATYFIETKGVGNTWQANAVAETAIQAGNEFIFRLIAQSTPLKLTLSMLKAALNHPNPLADQLTESILSQTQNNIIDQSMLGHALGEAISKGYVNSCRLLVNYGTLLNVPCSQRHDEGSCLHLAAEAPYDTPTKLSIFEILLEAGADPNFRNKEGVPAWFLVTDHAIFDLFVAKGADLHATTKLGESVLHSNCTEISILRTVLEQGVDVHRRHTESGRSALHDPKMTALKCRLLLEFGADVNACDLNGDSPLSFIVASIEGRPVFNDKIQCIANLLDSGAAPNVMNTNSIPVSGVAGPQRLSKQLMGYPNTLQLGSLLQAEGF